MASCSRASRWRSRPARASRAPAPRRWPPRAAGRTKCRSITGASWVATSPRRATWRARCSSQLRTLGITERIDAVVAVPADLDPGALADAARRAARGGRRYARFRRLGGAGCGGDRRTRPLRAARGGLALRHGHARVGRRRMRVRRSLRERARQPARRLRPVAGRGGGGHGQEHAFRSAAQPRVRAAVVRFAAAGGRARRDRGTRRSRARGRWLAFRGRRGRATVRCRRAAFLPRAGAAGALGAHRRPVRGAGVARGIAPLARISRAACSSTNRTAW